LLEFEQVADALERSRLAHRAAAATGIGDTAPLTLRVAIHQDTYLGRVAIAHYAGGKMPGPAAGRVSAATRIQAIRPIWGISLRRSQFGTPCRSRDLMRLKPESPLATFARRRQPFRQPETGAAYMEGLRAAGFPD